MLTEGRVEVDGKVIHKAKHIVVSGSKVVILEKKKAEEFSEKPKKNKKKLRIKILFEDEDIIAVNKQAGLLSISTNKMEPDTLHSRVMEYLQDEDKKAWAYIVHRLDRETSGVMIFAKDKQSKDYLQEQFADRSVHRVYHALVEGRPENESGTIREWLLEDKFLRVKAVNKKHLMLRKQSHIGVLKIVMNSQV